MVPASNPHPKRNPGSWHDMLSGQLALAHLPVFSHKVGGEIVVIQFIPVRFLTPRRQVSFRRLDHAATSGSFSRQM